MMHAHRPGESPTPRMRLIIASQHCEHKYPYHAIEIHFTADEARILELKLAQALGTRNVRKDAGPITRITKQQARKRLI